jgi:hypothetical protein
MKETLATPTTPHFDEKVLYKTRRHWIIPVVNSIKLILIFVVPSAVILYFFSGYHLPITCIYICIALLLVAWYDHYLWEHSWLIIGNQKITLSVRSGIFSQFAMNIRYRNIRDCAVTKKSIWSFLFKFGTIFIRSSANE